MGKKVIALAALYNACCEFETLVHYTAMQGHRHSNARLTGQIQTQRGREGNQAG